MRLRRILRLLLPTAALVAVLALGLTLDGALATILRGYLIVAISASVFVVAIVTGFDVWRRR